MRMIKIIIGVIALLWIGAHLLDPLGSDIPSGDLATSWWTGKLVAILIGIIIAIVCFRPSKQKVESSGEEA